MTILILPTMLFVYYKLMTNDPGRVRASAQDGQTGKTLTLVDLCMLRNPPYIYCSSCDLITSTLSKHCRLCEQCYSVMDHHCLFLLKCVASNNHVLFVWLLILLTINMGMYLLAFVFYTLAVYPQLEYTAILMNLIHYQAWPFSLLLLNLGSAFWSINLICYQYSMIVKGCTTYFNDFDATHQPLSHQHAITNFLHFLAGRPLPYKNPRSPLETIDHPLATKVRDIPTHLQVQGQVGNIQIV